MRDTSVSSARSDRSASPAASGATDQGSSAEPAGPDARQAVRRCRPAGSAAARSRCRRQGSPPTRRPHPRRRRHEPQRVDRAEQSDGIAGVELASVVAHSGRHRRVGASVRLECQQRRWRRLAAMRRHAVIVRAVVATSTSVTGTGRDRLAMPCDNAQMCSAIIMAGGRLPGGMAATMASQAWRSTPNAGRPPPADRDARQRAVPTRTWPRSRPAPRARRPDRRHPGARTRRAGSGGPRPRRPPGGPRSARTAPGDVGHQRVAIAEVAVGCGGADAGLARGFREGEPGRALLGN